MAATGNENTTPDELEKRRGGKRGRGPKRLRVHNDLHQHTHHYYGGGEEQLPDQFALTAGYQQNLSPDRAKAKRVVGSEAKIPVSNTDGHFAEQNQLATVAGACGSTEVAPGTHLGKPSDNPLGRAVAFAQEHSAKGAREWSAGADVVPFTHKPDYKQQPPTAFQHALAVLRANPYHAVGQTGFHSDFTHTDDPAGAPGIRVHVNGFDAAAYAGEMRDVSGRDVLDSIDFRPAVRTEYHQHRTSATPDSQGHSLRDPLSHAVATKSRLDIVKDAMKEQGII